LLGDCFQLLLRPRRQDHVGAGVGERRRDARTDAASGAGHDRHAIVETKRVERAH
jgi:hypothetical protein